MDAPVADLRQLIDDSAERLRKEMMNHLTAAWARTRFGLHRIIEGFIKDEDQKFAAYLAQAKQKEWICDTTPLRRALGTFFRNEYPSVKASLRARLERGVARMIEKLTEAGLGEAADVQLNSVGFDDAVPVTTALSRVVSFDMEWSWWRGWLSRLQSHSKLREELITMIREQFFPIEQELMAATGRNLDSAVQSSIDSFLLLQRNLVDLEEQRRREASVVTRQGIAELLEVIRGQEKIEDDCRVLIQEIDQISRGWT